MKKQILVSSAIAIAILGGTCTVILNDANAEKSHNDNLVAVNSAVSTPAAQLSTSKNETVFVMTDESGAVKSKFIGSTLYDGAEELPFDFKITYYLDGQEISAKDLSGKSGHVKIVYSYNSNAKYLGRNIPFVALTGLTLDRANFSNVKLENGKIITENTDNYIITGYAIAGLNANLNIDLLPESFTLEADAKDFKLKDSYTIFTNELIADIDTSKLNDLDSLVSSIYQLSDALDQIIAGSTELSNGVATALDGTKALYTGSQTLTAGLEEATNGASSLSENLNNLNNNLSASLNTGASNIFDSILATTSATLTAQISQMVPGFSITLTQDTYKTQLDYLKTQLPATYADSIDETKAKLETVGTFCYYLNFYTTSVGAMAEKAPDLVSGLTDLSTGASKLSAGLGSLVEGTEKLYAGSITLRDGLTTFKTSGIDKLVNFASKDLSNFLNNLRGSVSAASSYKNFGNTDAKNVKFIVKTPSI